MIGTTPSIGYESSSFPEFTTEMAQKVVNHANKVDLGEVSFWNAERDLKIASAATNQEDYSKGEFSEVFKQFAVQ